MVAALGLLEAEEILVELLLARPGGAVDPLQLRVVGVAAPIGAGHVHQLERLAEMPGRRQMRPDAQIDEIALAVEADLLACRDLADIFGLVALADAGEEGDRGVALPDLAGDLLVAADDLAHPLLDLLEVFRGERLVAGEIVIEAGLGRGAEGDLGLGIKLLDRLGHHVGGVVAQDLEPLGRFAGDDCDRGVMVDHGGEVARPAVDLDGDRRLGEPGSDRAASSAPVTGPPNSRCLPSGKVTTIGADGPGCRSSSRFSAISPPANKQRTHRAERTARFIRRSLIFLCSVDLPLGRGPVVTKRPRPLSGGVYQVKVLALDQRTRPPGTPPRGVVVVVVTFQLLTLMPAISRTDRAASRYQRQPVGYQLVASEPHTAAYKTRLTRICVLITTKSHYRLMLGG